MRRRYSTSYFLSTGVKSFFRNGFMSLSAIVILISAMLICGSFILVIMNIDYNIEQIDDFNEVVVFADLSATDEQVAAMQEKILQHPNVASCTIIPKEVSIKEESERYGEEHAHLFERYIENENENPLPDTLRIEYKDVNQLDTLENYLNTEVEGVYKVNIRKDIADNINRVKHVIMIICIVLTGLLLVVSLFIIGNTIKITLKSREKEITIMRYIGATNTFITLPFVVESAIVALISTLIAAFIQIYSYRYITEKIVAQYGIVETISVNQVWLYIIAGFALVSFVLCVFGTIVSTRRYMKA